MISSRDSILAALFGRLCAAQLPGVGPNGSTMWETTGRRLKLWSDVPAGERPAMFMADHLENVAEVVRTMPGVATMEVEVFVYIDASDRTAIPSTDLNNCIDAIAAVLEPTAAGPQTLGGLVTSCRIEGRILKDPGDLDGEGLAVIPIKILAP